jgi:hypothetical protein
MMRVPAITLNRCGFVVSVNAAAHAIFDNDVKMKDKRLFVRNLEARTLLKASMDKLTGPGKSKSLIAEDDCFGWKLYSRLRSSGREISPILKLCFPPKPGSVSGSGSRPRMAKNVIMRDVGHELICELRDLSPYRNYAVGLGHVLPKACTYPRSRRAS